MSAKPGRETASAGPAPAEDDWLRPCHSLADVRANIDRLDDAITRLLCQRLGYVVEAARFKPSVAGVVVPERVEEIVRRVRGMAEGYGANPDTLEAVYRALIDAFTRDEQARWRALHSERTP